MGCWSVKCAVTQLPIRMGDEIVILLGVRGKPHDHYEMMVRNVFSLVAPPLYGAYDEYGWIDLEGQSPDYINFVRACMKINFKEDAEEVETRSESDEDGLIGFEDMHWNDLLDQMREKLHEDFDFTYIHRKVWDNLAGSVNGLFAECAPSKLFHSQTDDDNFIPRFNKAFTDFGCRVGNYNIYGTPENAFRASLSLLNEPTFDKLSEFPWDSGPYSRHSYSTVINLLGWWKYAQKSSFDIVADWGYARKVFGLADTPEKIAAVFQVQKVYTAIRQSGIIVRGHEDVGVEEQDGGPMFAHRAIPEATIDILSKDDPYSEEEEEKRYGPMTLNEKMELIKQRSDSDLDKSYEWR